MKTQTILFLAIIAWLFSSAATYATTASFQGLGDLPGGSVWSIASAVSADGSTVVGDSYSGSGREAFRWTSSGAMQGLGCLPADSFCSTGESVSGDGTVVVGRSDSGSTMVAYRWTVSGGMEGLGILEGGSWSKAYNVSDDGFVVVGVSLSSRGQDAFRWTATGGMKSLSDPLLESVHCWAMATCADGSVVVGMGNGGEAFRWTQTTGMVGLGDLPGGDFFSEASAVSTDGSVIVGKSSSASGWREAFRWTQSEGMVALGDLPGGEFVSEAMDVSADGSVVVGEGWSATSTSEAFIWDATNGMQNLRTVLENDYGLDLTGWTLHNATGISDDGLTIVGYGKNPYGNEEAWIAQLPVKAEVDIKPKTINLQSKGGLITCQIWLPEEYDVADVNAYSVFLEDEIGAEWIWYNEQQHVVMAKFSRLDMQDILEPGEVELTVTGELLDGTRFAGTDTIKVIDNRKAKP